jgi:hypothetical protein
LDREVLNWDDDVLTRIVKSKPSISWDIGVMENRVSQLGLGDERKKDMGGPSGGDDMDLDS